MSRAGKKNNQMVTLMQAQVERLEKDLAAKTAEVDALTAKVVAETNARVTTEAKLQDVQRRGEIGAESASTATRVELAKATAVIKSLEEGENRHKQRIRDLQASLAAEKELRGDAEFQVESKQATIEYVATELERVEEEKKDAIAQMELKQNAIELLSANVDTLTAVVAQHEKDAERHQAEWAKAKNQYEEKLKMSSGTFHEQEIRWETRNMEQEQRLSEANSKIERLEDDLADLKERSEEIEVSLRKRIADWETLHAETKARHESEIDKLETGVAAIQSGRGRLEQIKELHQQREAEAQEFKERIANLESAIEELQAENEGLAESNAQLAEVLDNAGDDSLSHIGSHLDARDHEARIKQLEATTMRQVEVIDALEGEKVRLDEDLERRELRIKDLEASEQALNEQVANLNQDLESLSSRHAGLKKTMDASNAVHKQKVEELEAKVEELKKQLETTTAERDTLRETKVTLESVVSSMKQQAEADATKHQDEVTELEEERASLKTRLNEAIQERWSLEESVKAAAAASKGKPNAAEASEVVILTAERDDLKRKLQSIETQHEELIKKKDKELVAVKEKLGDHIIQLNTQKLDKEKLTLKVKQLQEQFSKASEKLDAAEAKAKAAAPTVKSITDAAAVEELQQDVKKLKARLEAQQEEAKEDAQLHEKALADVKAMLKKTEQECEELHVELEKASSSGSSSKGGDDGEATATLKAEVAQLKEKLAAAGDASEATKALEAEIAELKQQLSSASGGAGEATEALERQISELKKQLAFAADEPKAEIEALKKQVAELKSAAPAEESDAGDVSGAEIELRDALDHTRKELADAVQMQVQMRDQIEDLKNNEGVAKAEVEAELEELKGNFEIAREALEEFEATSERLAEVEEQLYQTEQELQEAKAFEAQLQESAEREEKLKGELSEVKHTLEVNEEAAAARKEVEELQAKVEKLTMELEAARILSAHNASTGGSSAEHEKQVADLKLQISKRDAELKRQADVVSELRASMTSHVAHAPKTVEQKQVEPEAQEVAPAPAVEEAPASEETGEAAADAALAWVPLNAARAESFTALVSAAYPKASSKEKEMIASPQANIVDAGGQVLCLAGEGDAVRGCAALIANGKEFEFNFCAAAEGEDALAVEKELLDHCLAYAQKEQATGVYLYWPGSMSDAEKRFGVAGFKVNGVGPPPSYATRWKKTL